jgi:hypothetical protein
MGAPQYPYPHRCAQPLGALRLDLAPSFGQTPDGQWRPYSRDLTREVPHLVNEFPKTRGRIDRLVYAPDDWDVPTTEVFTSHGRMKIGYLRPDQPGGVVLLRLSGSIIITVGVTWTSPRGMTD